MRVSISSPHFLHCHPYTDSPLTASLVLITAIVPMQKRQFTNYLSKSQRNKEVTARHALSAPRLPWLAIAGKGGKKESRSDQISCHGHDHRGLLLKTESYQHGRQSYPYNLFAPAHRHIPLFSSAALIIMCLRPNRFIASAESCDPLCFAPSTRLPTVPQRP